MSEPASSEKIRIDKWLWYARVVKTRTLAKKLVQAGKVRLSGNRVGSAATTVRPQDVLTITLERRILVYRILSIGSRRGPAAEARLLYDDLSPPTIRKSAADKPLKQAVRKDGAGRPTKRDRRKLDRFRARTSDDFRP